MSMSPTVAPQLASFAAIERPSPRPAPVTRTASSLRSCWMAIAPPSLQGQLPRIAVAHDPAGRRIAEMTADDEHLAVRVALDELEPRLRAERLVHVEIAVDARRGQLDR